MLLIPLQARLYPIGMGRFVFRLYLPDAIRLSHKY